MDVVAIVLVIALFSGARIALAACLIYCVLVVLIARGRVRHHPAFLLLFLPLFVMLWLNGLLVLVNLSGAF